MRMAAPTTGAPFSSFTVPFTVISFCAMALMEISNNNTTDKILLISFIVSLFGLVSVAKLIIFFKKQHTTKDFFVSL